MMTIFDVDFEIIVKSQKKLLDEQLKDGFPLIFCDDDGRFLQKNPDGSIEDVTNIINQSRKSPKIKK